MISYLRFAADFTDNLRHCFSVGRFTQVPRDDGRDQSGRYRFGFLRRVGSGVGGLVLVVVVVVVVVRSGKCMLEITKLRRLDTL